MYAWYKEDQSTVTSVNGAYFEVYLLFLELKTPNYFSFFYAEGEEGKHCLA